MTKLLDIYISEHYGNYDKVDSLVLNIDLQDENKFDYYAEELTKYFYRYYEIKDINTDERYKITSQELKLILNESMYYLGSYQGVKLFPNRVKFIHSTMRIKYFTDICD